MTRTYRLALASTLVLALGAGAATAVQAQSFAVGANVGTPGIGAELQYQVSDWIVVRGAGDFAEFDRDETLSGIAYAGKLKMATGGAFVDLHPGGGGFLLSGGAYFGKRRAELDGQPTGNVDIGGTTYTPAQVGRIDGDIKMSDLQPFVGVGYDSTFTRDSSLGVKGMLGVAFSDSPEVNLTASGGTLSNTTAFQTNLRREEAEVREDAKDYKYFPVAQIGLTYRF